MNQSKRRPCFRFRQFFVVVAGAALLTGCVNLAPQYEQPAPPAETADKWAVNPADAAVRRGPVVPWEQFFLDERLRKVIRLTLDNNRDLRQAMLEVERLRALYRVSRSELLPAVGAAASATHARSSSDATLPGAPRTSHVYAANLAMTSYELDLFGRIRNLNEQALQGFQASVDARRSAQNTLIAEVAMLWLSVGADRAMLDLSRETLKSQSASYALVEKSFKAGAANQLELSQAQSTVSAAKAAVESARKSLMQDRNALRMLAGAELPEELLPGGLELGATMPATLPPELPSEVLLNRPDIAIAEHQLRSANANIGVARAAFFPRVTLTSSIGTLSAEMSNLFDGGRGTWSFAPSVSVPLFTGGALTANLEAAKIAQKQSVAAYEKAIQSAFREVNDALAAESTVTGRLAAQDELVKATSSAYRLAELRYRHGVDSYLSVLDAQRAYVGARQAQIGARLERAVSLVTLYKVLGGGQELADESSQPKAQGTSS